MTNRKLFTELKQRTDRIPDAELDTFWATLAPATIDDMLGEWSGGEFDTGHRINGLLANNTVMGIMNGKHVVDDGRHFYFYLERAEDRA